MSVVGAIKRHLFNNIAGSTWQWRLHLSVPSLQGVARSLTRDESKPTDLHFYQLMQMQGRSRDFISSEAASAPGCYWWGLNDGKWAHGERGNASL